MQGGRYADNDQLDYRSYKCKVQCEPDPQNTLNVGTILKQLNDFKNDFTRLSEEVAILERNCSKKDALINTKIANLNNRHDLVFD